MNFIDDIDFIFSLIRFKSGLFYQITDIFHTCIARCIYFDDVEHGAVIERLAMDTDVTGIAILEIETIHSLREDTSTCRLSCSTRSMKKISMIDSATYETIFQDSSDITLSDN